MNGVFDCDSLVAAEDEEGRRAVTGGKHAAKVHNGRRTKGGEAITGGKYAAKGEIGERADRHQKKVVETTFFIICG